ncbi:MAG: hypothetical protein WCA39_10175, partial [Nitrososphaeraceae archaeon]
QLLFAGEHLLQLVSSVMLVAVPAITYNHRGAHKDSKHTHTLPHIFRKSKDLLVFVLFINLIP